MCLSDNNFGQGDCETLNNCMAECPDNDCVLACFGEASLETVLLYNAVSACIAGECIEESDDTYQACINAVQQSNACGEELAAYETCQPPRLRSSVFSSATIVRIAQTQRRALRRSSTQPIRRKSHSSTILICAAKTAPMNARPLSTHSRSVARSSSRAPPEMVPGQVAPTAQRAARASQPVMSTPQPSRRPATARAMRRWRAKRSSPRP